MKVKTIDGEIHGKDKEYIINLFGDFDWLGYKQLIVSPEMQHQFCLLHFRS